MPSLAELQRLFGSFLTAPPGRGPDEPLTGTVLANGIGVAERLAVYKNNVYTGLIDALAATYPAVARLVGDDFFRFAAREFIISHPAEARTLIGYGGGFAAFLESFEPVASVPYLPDVARLEYLYLEAYHAAEAEPLTRTRFEALLRDHPVRPPVALHPSSRLMSSPYPVSRIWEINVREDPIDGKVRIEGETEYLLVIRPRARVEVRRLAEGAFTALGALEAGLDYASALEAGVQANPTTNVREHLLSLADSETFAERQDIA